MHQNPRLWAGAIITLRVAEVEEQMTNEVIAAGTESLTVPPAHISSGEDDFLET